MEYSNTVKLEELAKKTTDKMMVKVFEQEDINTHDHNCFELAYIIDGSAQQTLNGKTEHVAEGAYFIIDYGSRHSYKECKNFKLINCLFFSESVDASLVNCRSFDELMRICMIRYYRQYLGPAPVNRIFYDDDRRVLKLLKEMQKEYEDSDIAYQEIFRGKLLEILILTMRKVIDQQTDVSVERLAKNSIIRKTVGYLEENYPDKAVLKSFCEKHHYSIQYISRRFKQETGLSVTDYIQKLRVEKSCALLIGSDDRIQDIASEVGYEDIKFFRRIFHEKVGMTPGEYRRAGRAV